MRGLRLKASVIALSIALAPSSTFSEAARAAEREPWNAKAAIENAVLLSLMPMVPVACLGLPVITLTIAADTYNYNLFSAAGSPTYPVDVRCTINAGATVGSTSNSAYAFVVGSSWAAGTKLTLAALGEVEGIGGTGARGRNARGLGGDVAATAGGPAINASGWPIKITGNGAFRGGGGGGGAGGAFWTGFLTKVCEFTDSSGGAGGGGRGFNGGAHLTGGGTAATDGTKTTPGTGGTGDPNAGAGGNGGDSAATGATGTNGTTISGTCKGFTNGTAGAVGGACTLGNANIDWTAFTGTRVGALN